MQKRPGLGGVMILWPLVAACSQQPVPENMTRESVHMARIDFSGSWEMDHSRSDDAYQELKALVRKLGRASPRSGQGDSRSRNMSVGVSSGTVNTLVALARLAEQIARPQVLEIEQSGREIEVKREDDFALTCDFYDRIPEFVETPFGTELCGWDGHQLIFHVSLPDGLTVQHRMTVAPDRQQLHVATTVASTAAPVPFTLNRVYQRFEPLPSEYDCEYTLSKKKTCSTRRSGL